MTAARPLCSTSRASSRKMFCRSSSSSSVTSVPSEPSSGAGPVILAVQLSAARLNSSIGDAGFLDLFASSARRRRDLRVDFLGTQHGIGAHHRRRRCCDGRLGDRRRRCRLGLSLPAHQRLELARLGIEHEQPLGQRRLVAQHVVQETQRAEVVAERIEVARRAFRCIVGQQSLDVVAHALHGLRSLIEAEYREHAAHLQQLARHGAQQALLGRPAEELVERFLEFAQVHAQLVDNASPWTGDRSRGDTAPPSRVRAARSARSRAHARCVRPVERCARSVGDHADRGLQTRPRGTAPTWRPPWRARSPAACPNATRHRPRC